MTMKANNFYLNILAAGMLAITTGCAGAHDTENSNETGTAAETSTALISFASISPDAAAKHTPLTRTSMDGHQYLTGCDFFWEPGDKIYVRDDNATMQNSGTNSNFTATQPTARFHVPGAYTASNTYEVYYTGTAATATSANVTIATAQTQTAPNTAKHIGASGDCGTATATRIAGDHFEFMLDHKAAYLCFLPRITNAALGQNVYLTKIVVKSDNAIAGDYLLSLAGLSSAPAANAATEITLTTQGTGTVNGPWSPVTNSYAQIPAPGFPLSNTVTSLATNAAYMVIAPGTHSITIDYYIKDPVTNVEGTVSKTLPANKLFEANKVYDITANLTPRDYSDRKYYMWDAQQDYWNGVNNYPIINGTINSNYAQNNSDPRWYNEMTGVAQASHSCQTLPNANEMHYYVAYGDPHYDTSTLWSIYGHLYKNGLWLKKLQVIYNELVAQGYSQLTSQSIMKERFYASSSDVGTDCRSTTIHREAIPAVSHPGSNSDFFYLPALGNLNVGFFLSIGVNGYAWSSSAYPDPHVNNLSYYLDFTPSKVFVAANTRINGFPVSAFE